MVTAYMLTCVIPRENPGTKRKAARISEWGLQHELRGDRGCVYCMWVPKTLVTEESMGWERCGRCPEEADDNRDNKRRRIVSHLGPAVSSPQNKGWKARPFSL